jgi:hypothetical protein
MLKTHQQCPLTNEPVESCWWRINKRCDELLGAQYASAETVKEEAKTILPRITLLGDSEYICGITVEEHETLKKMANGKM